MKSLHVRDVREWSEVFQLVLPHLNDSMNAMLAVQSVSRTINSKLRRVDGSLMYDPRGGVPLAGLHWRRKRHIRAMVRLEKTGFPSKTLSRLTCSGCGDRKEHSTMGLSDQEFDKASLTVLQLQLALPAQQQHTPSRFSDI